MSDFYEDLQGITQDVLGELKQGTIMLISITPGVGDDDEPGEPTENEYELDGAVKGVSKKFVDQGFAVATDLMVTTAVRDDVTPSVKDFIEIDGVRHKIVKDVSVPAAGTKVAWKFIVRKGG